MKRISFVVVAVLMTAHLFAAWSFSGGCMYFDNSQTQWKDGTIMLVIGKSTSPVKLKLSNDVLYFFTGDETSVTTDNAIAYFSTNRLYVNNSTIRNITLGDESQALDIRILGEGDNVCAFFGGRLN